MPSLRLAVCTAIGLAFGVAPPGPVSERSTAQSGDPAVDAYVSFVDGKELKAPADLHYVIAALDRLVSAVEGLALRERGSSAPVLKPARLVRQQIRMLQPSAGDSPERLRNRWKVFVAAGKLIDDLAAELGTRGATMELRAAILRAADSIEYVEPPRWQPDALEIFFDLAAQALTQMARDGWRNFTG